MPIQISLCPDCGRSRFEPAETCAHCGGTMEKWDVPGIGRVYSYSEVHLGAEGMETPYLLALVDLEGAGRVMGRIRGKPHDRLKVDGLVRFDELSDAGPVFRLEGSAEESDV